jgi:hypothetical protein
VGASDFEFKGGHKRGFNLVRFRSGYFSADPKMSLSHPLKMHLNLQ